MRPVSVFPLARIGHCRVVTMQALSGKNMRFDQTMKWLQRRGTCSDLIGQCRQADVDALAGIAFALAIERLVLANFSNRIIASRFGPAKPRGVTWKGAGGCVIFSQLATGNFSRTVWMTFH